MTFGQWLLQLASAASFASAVLINKILVAQIPPFTLAALRVLLAVPVCLVALALLGRRLPGAGDRGTVVLASLAVVVDERLGAGAFVGMALILAGSVVVNGVGIVRRPAAAAWRR